MFYLAIGEVIRVEAHTKNPLICLTPAGPINRPGELAISFQE